MTRFSLCFFKISVGFHVGFGCKPKPHMQSLAASDGSWSTDNGVLFCWLPCWFPAFRVWGRSPWERYHGGPCWVPCWSMLASMLASMLVSSFQGMGEVTMGKVPWGSMLGSMLASLGVHVGFHVGFRVGFQVWGYGGGHHGKGTVGVHVGCHVGFHVGFQLPGYGGGHHGKDTVGVHVGFHVGPCWLPCWLPCWFPAMLGSMLASVLVSRCEGMGEVTMGKVPWGSMLGAMLASMLGSSCQGMGEVTMGKIVGFHVGFHVGSCKIYLPITEVFRARSIQNIRTQNAAHGDPTGCPWSAYLFLLVMTCVDSDGKSRSSGHALNSRIPGAGFDAVYYADDTILFSTTPRGLNEILKHMEDCSGHYASKLNRGKCHSLNLHREANIHFRDGTVLHKAQDATYLGNNLNHIANPKREIRQRIQDVMTTWRGLAISWKASSAGKKTAAGHLWCCCQKLLYNLETVYLTRSLRKKLETFQLHGLRQILKLPTIFIDRRWTYARVYELASQTAYLDNPAQKVRLVTEELDEIRVRLAGHILQATNGDSLRQVIRINLTALSPSVPENVELVDHDNWVCRSNEDIHCRFSHSEYDGGPTQNLAILRAVEKPSNRVQKPSAQASLFWCRWPRHGMQGKKRKYNICCLTL